MDLQDHWQMLYLILRRINNGLCLQMWLRWKINHPMMLVLSSSLDESIANSDGKSMIFDTHSSLAGWLTWPSIDRSFCSSSLLVLASGSIDIIHCGQLVSRSGSVSQVHLTSSLDKFTSQWLDLIWFVINEHIRISFRFICLLVTFRLPRDHSPHLFVMFHLVTEAFAWGICVGVEWSMWKCESAQLSLEASCVGRHSLISFLGSPHMAMRGFSGRTLFPTNRFLPLTLTGKLIHHEWCKQCHCNNVLQMDWFNFSLFTGKSGTSPSAGATCTLSIKRKRTKAKSPSLSLSLSPSISSLPVYLLNLNDEKSVCTFCCLATVFV